MFAFFFGVLKQIAVFGDPYTRTQSRPSLGLEFRVWVGILGPGVGPHSRLLVFRFPSNPLITKRVPSLFRGYSWVH